LTGDKHLASNSMWMARQAPTMTWSLSLNKCAESSFLWKLGSRIIDIMLIKILYYPVYSRSSASGGQCTIWLIKPPVHEPNTEDPSPGKQKKIVAQYPLMRLLTSTACWGIVQFAVALTRLWSGQIHTASLNSQSSCFWLRYLRAWKDFKPSHFTWPSFVDFIFQAVYKYINYNT